MACLVSSKVSDRMDVRSGGNLNEWLLSTRSDLVRNLLIMPCEVTFCLDRGCDEPARASMSICPDCTSPEFFSRSSGPTISIWLFFFQKCPDRSNNFIDLVFGSLSSDCLL